MMDRVDSLAVRIYNRRIRQYINPGNLPFFIGQIANTAILTSNLHRSLDDSQFEKRLYEIFKYAKEFFIDAQKLSYSEDAIYNAASLIIRNADAQFPFYAMPRTFARPLILFLKLANEAQGFNFMQEFQRNFQISLDFFLQSAVLIYSLTNKGYFNRNFTNADKRLILPPTKDLVTTLDLLSASPKMARDISDKLKPKDSRFYNFQFNILRIRPILQPRENKYISPIRDMVLSQISEIIYYKMHEFYSQNSSNTFTEWFGNLFQIYVEDIIRKYIVTDEEVVFSEKKIEQLGCRSMKKPDLLIVSADRTTAILVECKAARKYRGTIQSDDKCQLFGATSHHVETGYKQLEEFAGNIRENNIPIKDLTNINVIYGVIITWEDLMIFNTFGVKNSKLPKTIQCDFICTVSLDHLENIAACSPKGLGFAELLHRLCKSRDSDTFLQQLIGQNINDCDFRLQEIKKFTRKLIIQQT